MNRREANEWLVAELLQARDAVRLAPNPSHLGIDLTLERAYQIGRGLHERLVARGFGPIGRKIGFTNRAMWEQFQVSEPIWAHVYAQTVHFAQAGHARVALGGMVAPRLEPEIVLKLRSPVPDGEPTTEELARCIEWAAAEGEGRNALGNPLLALGWLARVLSAQPWAPSLAPGEVITTGTLTSYPHVRAGESYGVEVRGAPLAPLQLGCDE